MLGSVKVGMEVVGFDSWLSVEAVETRERPRGAGVDVGVWRLAF